MNRMAPTMPRILSNNFSFSCLRQRQLFFPLSTTENISPRTSCSLMFFTASSFSLRSGGSLRGESSGKAVPGHVRCGVMNVPCPRSIYSRVVVVVINARKYKRTYRSAVSFNTSYGGSTWTCTGIMRSGKSILCRRIDPNLIGTL